MIKSLNIRTVLMSSGFAVIAGLALAGQTGGASASNVLSCEGGSRQSVIECCQRLVEKKGMPVWMRQAGGGSCNKMTVSCRKSQTGTSAAAGKPVCVAVRLTKDRNNGGQSQGGRSPNGANGAGKP